MYRKFTLFTLILALVVIVLGSYVRSSGVELGCPDWPGCYGKAWVSDDTEFMADAKANFPYSRVDLSKAKKEMAYRYLSGFLAISIVILAIFSWTQKKYRIAALTASILLLVLLGGHTALAMWVVKLKGMPIIISGQVLLGCCLFWLVYWLYLRTNNNITLADPVIKRGPRVFAQFAILILFLRARTIF